MLLPTYLKVKPLTLKRLCCYFNSTDKMQLIRVSESNDRQLEKVIFPRQRFLFEAIPNASLEVYTGREGKEFLQSTISCNELQVD